MAYNKLSDYKKLINAKYNLYMEIKNLTTKISLPENIINMINNLQIAKQNKEFDLLDIALLNNSVKFNKELKNLENMYRYLQDIKTAIFVYNNKYNRQNQENRQNMTDSRSIVHEITGLMN